MRTIPRHASWNKKILKNLSSFFLRFYGSKSIQLNGTPIPVGHFRLFTNGRKKCYNIVQTRGIETEARRGGSRATKKENEDEQERNH